MKLFFITWLCNHYCRHTGLQEKIRPKKTTKGNLNATKSKGSKQIQSKGTAALSSNPSECHLVLDPQYKH